MPAANALSASWRTALRHVWRHRVAAVGGLIVGVFLLLAIIGLFVHTPPQFERLAPPSLAHPLGTDPTGRDALALICAGAATSLQIGLLAVLLSIAVGVPIGLIAGYAGGWIDHVLGRLIDMLMAFPSLLLVLAFVAITGKSYTNLTLAVGIVGAPLFARQVRAAVLVVKNLDFVAAAVALGYSHSRILLRTVAPNCLTPVLILATLGLGTAILDVAGLSFLGLAGDPAVPEWGRMLLDNRNEIGLRPVLMVAPGIAIMVTVLGFNLLGDGLRDLLDPRLRNKS